MPVASVRFTAQPYRRLLKTNVTATDYVNHPDLLTAPDPTAGTGYLSLSAGTTPGLVYDRVLLRMIAVPGGTDYLGEMRVFGVRPIQGDNGQVSYTHTQLIRASCIRSNGQAGVAGGVVLDTEVYGANGGLYDSITGENRTVMWLDGPVVVQACGHPYLFVELIRGDAVSVNAVWVGA